MTVANLEFAWGVSLGTEPTAVQWINANDYLRAWSSARGRERDLDRIEAGTLTFTLGNLTRRFDSEYASGPYYGNIRPDVHVRLRLDSSPVFRGIVRAWTPSYPAQVDAIVQGSCVDGFYLLQNGIPRLTGLEGQPMQLDWSTAGGVGPDTDRVDVAIRALLPATIPAAQLDLGTAASSVVRADVEDELLDQTVLVPVGWDGITPAYRLERSVLDVVQTLAQTEEGLFLFSPDGKATFRSRSDLANAPYNAPQATFGDAGGNELAYTDLVWALDDVLLVETASVSRPGGDPQIAGASSSPHTLTRDGMFHVTDAESKQHAEWLVNTHDVSRLEVRSLTFKPGASSALKLEALTRRIGHLLTVIRRPPGGGMITKTCRVERIEMSASAAGGMTVDSSWEVTYSLSAWDATLGGATIQPLVWDDTLRGVWDENVWSF